MPRAGTVVVVRTLVCLSGTLSMLAGVIGVPVPVPAREEKDIVLLPMPLPATRFVQVPVAINPHHPFYYQQYPAHHHQQQIRGPFDFVGQWIQQTPWLPLQVNVPDIFQNIGNGISQASSGVQQWGQNVGNGVSQLTQNVGSGVSQFTQNVGSGFNQFTQNVGNGFNQWMQQLGQRVPFLGNIVGVGSKLPNGQQQVVVMVPVEYPGGQQLIMEETLEAFP